MDLVPVVDIAHPEATSLTALDRACSDLAAHAGDPTTSSMRLNHYTVGDPVPADEREGLADLGADDTQIATHRIAG